MIVENYPIMDLVLGSLLLIVLYIFFGVSIITTFEKLPAVDFFVVIGYWSVLSGIFEAIFGKHVIK